MVTDTMLYGRIIMGVGGNYHVTTDEDYFICQARGLFRKHGISPLVGDFVEFSVVDYSKKTGYLQKIMPRNNELLRPKAANVDQVILVSAIVPPFSPEVVDGFLINCEKQKVDVVLCINKIDLDYDSEGQKIKEAYQKAKYKVITASALNKNGLNELNKVMLGKTSILAGSSGVGKSSLLNALYPQFSLKVGELSEKIKRGKHTTRHTMLLKVQDGTYVVDSPGFTSFSIAHIKPNDLQYYYPEFKPFLGLCYYIDCIHISEHDCAVKEQVGDCIDVGRYARYVRYVTGGNNE